MRGVWWTLATPPRTSAMDEKRSPRRDPRRPRHGLGARGRLGGGDLLFLDRGAGSQAHGKLARADPTLVLAVAFAADLRGAARDPAQARARRGVLRARAPGRSRLAAGIEVASGVGADGRVFRCGALFAERRVASDVRAEPHRVALRLRLRLGGGGNRREREEPAGV